MDERSILIAAFVCGVALQAIILLRGDWNWLKISVSVFLALGYVAYGSDKSDYDQELHILLGLFAFSVLFAFLFKEDILPPVSEKLLLSYTLTFWFAFFTNFFSGTPLQIGLLCVGLLPTVATIFFAFRRANLNTFWKVTFYSWFLCIIVGLGLLTYSYAHLSMFFNNRNLPWTTPVDSALAGMAFLYLVVNASYLYYLVPSAGTRQTPQRRAKGFQELTDLMVQRFDGALPSHAVTLLILGVQGSVLILEYFFRLVPAGLLISVFILLPGVLLSLKSSPQDPADSTGKTTQEGAAHSRHLKKKLMKRPSR